jgi:RNA polymerase sigma factor (sigma-70 family)
MEQSGGDNRTLTDVIPEVEKAAIQAAIQVLGPGARDLHEEVVAEVYLSLVRAWHRSPPTNPAGWAFAVAVNCAKRLGKRASKDRQRHAELSDNLVLSESAEGSTISVEAGLETLDKLVGLTNRVIHDVGGVEDRRIFVLFHVKGQNWEEIAAAVNVSPSAARRRYYRLIRRATSVIRQHATKDPLLSERCATILTDDAMFRCALLSLLNVVGRKGFPAIREILESFLSE